MGFLEMREWLLAYDVEAAVTMLKQRIPTMRKECLATLRTCSSLLKHGAMCGLTAFEIGSLMMRPFTRTDLRHSKMPGLLSFRFISASCFRNTFDTTGNHLHTRIRQNFFLIYCRNAGTDEPQQLSVLEQLLKEAQEEEALLPGIKGSRRRQRLQEKVELLLAAKCAEVAAARCPDGSSAVSSGSTANGEQGDR